MNIRLADENELNRINELRKQLYDFHAFEKPDVFKPACAQKMQESIYSIRNDPEQDIAVAEQDGTLCGYAVMHHIIFAETPVMLERDFLNVDEICVDETFRGQGIAKAMLAFIHEYAAKKGIHRVELCVWEFNENASAVYEAAGFRTYKRSMEMIL